MIRRDGSPDRCRTAENPFAVEGLAFEICCAARLSGADRVGRHPPASGRAKVAEGQLASFRRPQRNPSLGRISAGAAHLGVALDVISHAPRPSNRRRLPAAVRRHGRIVVFFQKRSPRSWSLRQRSTARGEAQLILTGLVISAAGRRTTSRWPNIDRVLLAARRAALDPVPSAASGHPGRCHDWT